MSESRTTYVIQMFFELYADWSRGGSWKDISGQLTDGYKTAGAARDAFAAGWDRLKRDFPEPGRFRIVERTVTETVHEI